MVKKIIIIGLLSLVVSSNSNAQDTVRMNQLEKQIQELKLRISTLESILMSPSPDQEIEPSSEGWKSVFNWRKLSPNMDSNDVKRILGKPHRVNGGARATWYYQNDGRIVFFKGKVYSWNEPRQ